MVIARQGGRGIKEGQSFQVFKNFKELKELRKWFLEMKMDSIRDGR